MSPTAAGVLKKGQVRMCGTRPLSGAAGPLRPAAPGVRIAEQGPDGAVLEVTCRCGETTYVHCKYAPTPASR